MSRDTPTDERPDSPIEGQVLLHAAALASVGPSRLPTLLADVQRHLSASLTEYRQRFECVHEDESVVAFVPPSGHWEELAEAVSLDRRAADAVQRAHEQQLLRIGSDLGRRDEFETALEIRTAVLVGLPARDGDVPES